MKPVRFNSKNRFVELKKTSISIYVKNKFVWIKQRNCDKLNWSKKNVNKSSCIDLQDKWVVCNPIAENIHKVLKELPGKKVTNFRKQRVLSDYMHNKIVNSFLCVFVLYLDATNVYEPIF